MDLTQAYEKHARKVSIEGSDSLTRHVSKAGPLWHYLRGKVESDEVADDLMQEAWIEAAMDESNKYPPEMLLGLRCKKVLSAYLQLELGRRDRDNRKGRQALFEENMDRIRENTVGEYTLNTVDVTEIEQILRG